MTAAWRVRALIDTEAFAHNLNRAQQLAPNSQLMAVVKANAYGHSPAALVEPLQQAQHLAVIDVAEAQQLRAIGLKQNIALLQGCQTDAEWHWAAANNAQPVIGSLWQLQQFLDWVKQGKNAPPIWLKLDTGMRRIGLSAAEFDAATALLQQSNTSLSVSLMTHFACADCDPNFTQQQQRRFEQLAAATPLAIAGHSLANSAAIFEFANSHADIVRPGIMLYGASPFANKSATELGLKPVMSLQAKVLAVRALQAGDSIGYGASWAASENCQIAVVAAGYGDGVPRSMPAGGKVAVGRVEASFVGRVSMDSCFLQLPLGADVAVGDVATLWGCHTDGRVYDVDALAAHADTIGYELLTRVSSRVPRVIAGANHG